MAIYCFPLLVDQEQLNLIDDIFEEVPIIRKQYEIQQLIWLFGQSNEICSQFDKWAIELRNTIQNYCGDNKILFNRFINSGITTIEGTLSFHNINYSSIYQLDNYINIRIQNSSVGFLNNFNHLFILKSLPTIYDLINDYISTYKFLEIKVKEKYIHTFKLKSQEIEFIKVINSQKYLIYGSIKYSIESRRYNCKELNQLLYKFKN
ncbi:hypothetical protein ACTFIT_007440 [Dictyostelium discoideum]